MGGAGIGSFFFAPDNPVWLKGVVGFAAICIVGIGFARLAPTREIRRNIEWGIVATMAGLGAVLILSAYR